MPADQFFRDRIQRIVDTKLAFFGRHLREKDGLQHQVAQFLSQARPIALINRIEDFISLFEQIWFDGVEVLFAIPGTASGGAQPRHDAGQALKTFPCCSWIV